MKTPRISALINTYNYGRFVGEAIESVLAQGLPLKDMEIIVVDDGSTDDTAAQVARFGERVRYVHKENGGQASALNVGFAEARGEIIALLDADDVWMPKKIARVAEAFEKHPEAGMVYHPSLIWDTVRNETYADPHSREISGYVPGRAADLMEWRGASTSGLSFQKKFLDALLPIPESLRIYADSFLEYLVIFVAPVEMVNEYLVRYRLHDRNLSSGRGDPARRERKAAYSKAAVQEMRAWFERRGIAIQAGPVRDYLRKYELWEESMRQKANGCGRVEFFRYLREEQKLYWPYWSARVRAYKVAYAAAGLVVGYETLGALRRLGGKRFP